MSRTDLLALDFDTLAALANRGLVKRAAKELDAGAGAVPSVEADGTLVGVFPDGTRVSLPPGAGLDQGTCTCGAPGICRHRLGLVLAWQRTTAEGLGSGGSASNRSGTDGSGPDGPVPDGSGPDGSGPDGPTPDGPTPSSSTPGGPTPSSSTPGGPTPSSSGPGGPVPGGSSHGNPGPGGSARVDAGWRPWSPGDLDDEALSIAVGARAVATARRALARGYTARLHHPTAEEPAARAELPTCTVRFPVPSAEGIGHAVTDAATARRGEVIALAVWAFRAATDADPAAPPAQVDVGGNGGWARPGASELGVAAALLDDLLLDGAAHAGPVLATALRRVRDELSGWALHWPAGILTELIEQLDDHAARGAGYRAERYAALITEFHARLRAAGRESGLAASQVLGSGERGDTALRRVRLTALGCRISGGPGERTAEVYLGHGGAGTGLVLRRRWDLAPGQEPTGPELAARRLAGASLGAVARGNLVSESASRTPGLSVTIGGGRPASTSVTPVGSAWAELPEPLLVRDFAAHARTLDRLPPYLVRPRTEAGSVHVVEVHEVGEVGYDPAEQRLEATVRDARGAVGTVSATHNPYSPGALDVLAECLRGDRGEVRHLSALVRVTGDGLRFDPIAVLTAEGVTVPDLAAPAVASRLAANLVPRPRDPLTESLESALSVLASAAGLGLRGLGEPARDRIEDSAAALSRTGLSTAAGLVRAFLAALREEGPGGAARPWVDAQIHLLCALELHARAA
ncbi:hypothetical protein [Streptomyces sp. NPDC059874]|uniref:hypothetical protein n=1 Tax=Streptomyces sp. NPDC059874 TaxID=3346983 RepID=UPI003660C0D5